MIGTCVIIAPEGVLDLTTSARLRTLVQRRIDDGAARILLDLTAVDFVDSTTLGVLVSIHRRLRDLGGRLVVVCPHSRVRRVLDLTGLDRVLMLTDSVDTALTLVAAR